MSKTRNPRKQEREKRGETGISDLRKFPRTKEYLLEWKDPVYLAQWMNMDRARSKCWEQ